MVRIVNETPVIRSPRVVQMESLFDVPPSEHSLIEWEVDLPLTERDWSVGLIVGPSGSGKSTIARNLWPGQLISGFDWPTDRSVLDAFPADMGIKDVVGLITSVGFGSPPSWMRPYRALSTGEQFRVMVARALAELPDLAVVDEFTSVVDRQVAQVASHTVQKAVRRSGRKLIAVTCHYDVADWLQPDWVYQPHANEFTWRSLQRRPTVDLEIVEVDRGAWDLFRRHHYLSGSLHPTAKRVCGFIDGEPVAFASWMHIPHPNPSARNIRIGHRLVVLPDWQGLGIGGRLDDWIGQYLYERGFRYHNTVAHPAMVAYYSRSPRWRKIGTSRPANNHSAPARSKRTGKANPGLRQRFQRSRLLLTSSWEYVPPKV